MIVTNIEYNPLTDVSLVDQFGYVDINECIATNTVPAGLNPTDESYNGLDDPNSIGGKPSDVFDGISMARSLSSRQSPEETEGT